MSKFVSCPCCVGPAKPRVPTRGCRDDTSSFSRVARDGPKSRRLCFAPKSSYGLITAVPTDAKTATCDGRQMNAEAVAKTVETGRPVLQRSRKALWKKGRKFGQIPARGRTAHRCDQDALWLKVEQEGPAPVTPDGLVLLPRFR